MPEIQKLGPLKPYDVDECLISEPVPVALFAGQAMAFIFNGTDDQEPDTRAAVERVLSMGEPERLAMSAPVYESYRTYIEACGLAPLDIPTPRDVWRCVTPHEMYVVRHDDDVYVAAMCECQWDVEHGLQLMLRGGHDLVRVSMQDGASLDD